MANSKGLLMVISAPGGAGKGTIIKHYLDKHEEAIQSKSYTTRAKRVDDVPDGKYIFVTHQEFDALRDAGKIFEYVEFCGNFYGTAKDYIEDKLNSSYDVILELDYRGALLVKEQMPEAVLVFVITPNVDVLYHRLDARGADTKDRIIERIRTGAGETATAHKYDYLLVNDTIDGSIEKLEAIAAANKSKDTSLLEAVECYKPSKEENKALIDNFVKQLKNYNSPEGGIPT